MPYEIDNRLTGHWRIIAHQAVVGRVLRVIGGIPNDVVQFDERGRYTIVTDPDRPLDYRYRCDSTRVPATIDLWMSNPEFFTLGVYRFDQEELVMCLAADWADRPDHFDRTADPKWVLTKYVRCEAPKPKKRRTRVKPLTEPGSLIPTEWLKKPTRGGPAAG